MGASEKAGKSHISCPYCDEEIMAANLPYCQACKLKVLNCPRCHKPVPRETTVCPHCKAEIKGQ